MSQAAILSSCEHCGAVITRRKKRGRDSHRFCSRPCAFAMARLTAGQNKAERRVASLVKRTRRCSVCGATFVAKAGQQSLCRSAECLRVYQRDKKRKQDQRLKPHLAGLYAAKACQRCGSAFTPIKSGRQGGPRTKYCSNTCSRMATHQGKDHCRRARRLGLAYDRRLRPQDIFDRDHWRCQLCGRATPKRLRRTTDPRAPELDHIVPIAKGGSHTVDNTQCACRECNGKKGSTIRGQLRFQLSA